MSALRRANSRSRPAALIGLLTLSLLLGGCRGFDDFRSSLVATKYIAEGDDLLMMGNRQAALAAFRRAEELRPGDRDVERLLVHRYALAGAPDLAESLLGDKVVSAEVYWALGLAFFRKDDKDKGVRYCERARAAAPDDPIVLNNVGFTYADYDVKLRDALRLCKEANLRKPDTDYIIDSVGWAYYKLWLTEQDPKLLQQARQHLERAAKMAPKSAEIRYHLGTLYSRMGLRREAEVELRAAVRCDPTLARAWEELRRLRWRLPPPAIA